MEKENTKLQKIRESMTEEQKQLNSILQQLGCNNCLTATPIYEYNYTLNKQELLDAVRLR